MEITDTRKRLETDGLITNLGPDVLYLGDKDVTVETGYPVAVDASVSVARTDFAYGVSEGTSEVVRLSGGTGVFPKGVDAPDVSGLQPLDSDLTAIAALTTTSYGRALLTLANAAAADWVAKALFDANTILAADSDNTPAALTVTASRIVGRKATGGIAALTGAEVQALLDFSTYALTADVVLKSLYDANTMLIATTDNTPEAIAVGTNKVVGRGNSGNIKALTAAETVAVIGSEVFTQAQGINPQTGTTYTLVAGDAGKMVSLSNVAAITLTLPQDSDATIAVGSYVDLYQLGAGQVTVVAGSGATLRLSGLTAKARAQYARFAVQKVSANTWVLFGDLAAS